MEMDLFHIIFILCVGTNLQLQKKLDPSLFKIACAQAAKNKWVEMGKLVTRKVILLSREIYVHYFFFHARILCV